MNFQVIYPKDIRYLQQERGAVVIDLRDRASYMQGHYNGAINYPEQVVTDLDRRLSRNRMYILYCEHGGSSMQMARDLGRKGFRVATVVGGWEAIKKK